MSTDYKLRLVDRSNFRLFLQKVRYDSLKVPGDLPDDVSFSSRTKDSYKISEITKDKVELEFKRERCFEPAGIFKMEIVLKIEYKLQPSKKTDKEREEIIQGDFKKDFKNLLAPAAAYASMIVSSLSIVNWRVPIIDPPFPRENKEVTNKN